MSAPPTTSDFDDVRAHFCTIVAAYVWSDAQPPYARADWLLMILFATGMLTWVCGAQVLYLPVGELLTQIASAKFYRKEALGFSNTFGPFDGRHDGPWYDILNELALPFMVLTLRGGDRSPVHGLKAMDMMLILRLHELFPGQKAQPVISGPDFFDRFFALPAEIRQEIIRLVAYRPAMFFRSHTRSFQALIRDPNDHVPVDQFVYPHRYHTVPGTLSRTILGAGTVAQIVGPLLTDRRLYMEAMPVFYTINTFYFNNVVQLGQFLGVEQLRTKPSSIDRKAYIRNIGFVYNASDRKHAKKSFELIASLVNLRKLSIHFHTYNMHYAQNGTNKYSGAVTLGDVLSQLGRLEVISLEGDCQTIAPEIARLVYSKRKEHRNKLAKKKEGEEAEKFTSCGVWSTPLIRPY